MQLRGYAPPWMDVSAVPAVGGALSWTEATVRRTARRAVGELMAILPTLQRLTEIVDPLDNTVVCLGRFVDRLPGAGRRSSSVREQRERAT